MQYEGNRKIAKGSVHTDGVNRHQKLDYASNLPVFVTTELNLWMASTVPHRIAGVLCATILQLRRMATESWTCVGTEFSLLVMMLTTILSAKNNKIYPCEPVAMLTAIFFSW
jgi:hypothetical protein